MSYYTFSYGYLISKDEMDKIKAEISLKDYAYARNLFLIKLQNDEYIFGMNLETIIPGELAATFNQLQELKIDTLLKDKIVSAYQHIIEPILKNKKRPQYIMAIATEEWEDEF